MDSDEVWENLLDMVIKYENEWSPVGKYSDLVDKLFDALAKRQPDLSKKDTIRDSERPIIKAGFIYRVGVGLYERSYYELAIEILEHALSFYRDIHNREGKEGIYACYGNICYCFRALGNQEMAKQYEKKTLEIENQLKLTKNALKNL